MQYVAQIQDDGKTITLLIKQGDNKEAVEGLRRLMNTNFENDRDIKVCHSRESNADTSLLIENK